MSEQMLELIKTRTIFLKEGQTSGEVVLVDGVGGNMYFTFLLKYINKEGTGRTHFGVIDDYHASMTIETKPNSFTQLDEPLEIGTYQKTRTLYIDVAVEPCMNSEERLHRVTVSFYTNQTNEVKDGVK